MHLVGHYFWQGVLAGEIVNWRKDMTQRFINALDCSAVYFNNQKIKGIAIGNAHFHVTSF